MHRTSRIIVGVLPQGFVPVRSPIGVVFPSEPSNRESEPGWAETAGICGSVARMEFLGLPHVARAGEGAGIEFPGHLVVDRHSVPRRGRPGEN